MGVNVAQTFYSDRALTSININMCAQTHTQTHAKFNTSTMNHFGPSSLANTILLYGEKSRLKGKNHLDNHLIASTSLYIYKSVLPHCLDTWVDSVCHLAL